MTARDSAIPARGASEGLTGASGWYATGSALRRVWIRLRRRNSKRIGLTMKLYLDLCCLKRPFDDQSQARIQLETLAIEAVLQLCRNGDHEVITSDDLRFENARNPNPERQQFAGDLLALAVEDVPHSAERVVSKMQIVA